MNGEANCILEVCCPPNAAGEASVTAKSDLAAKLQKWVDGLTPEYADKCADAIYKHFDLAERGTLQAFKASIVKVFKNQ